MASTRSEPGSASTNGKKWWHWLEPWYLAYGLQGATVAGLAPILLPLAVSTQGSAAHVGLVMAAFNLGGLLAPLWGGLADGTLMAVTSPITVNTTISSRSVNPRGCPFLAIFRRSTSW